MRTFLFGTLRGRLILSVAAVHAVMMTLFIADLTMRQRAMLLDMQTQEAVSMSQSLATSAAVWIAADDLSGLQELVDSERRYPELRFAVITDESGRILADTDASKLGLHVADLPRQPQQTVQTRSAALVDVAVPAMVNDKQVGWARVGIGQKVAAQELDVIVREGVLYALAAIVIGSSIAWWMGRIMTRRLYVVQDTMGEVRRGVRTARCRMPGTDEAASIAHEFDTMLDTLDERDQALRQSETSYRLLSESLREKTQELDNYFTNALDLLCIADTQGHFRRLNPEWESTLGYSVSELEGRRFLDFVHPDDREATVEALSRLGEQREVLGFANRYRCKNGAYRWIEWRSFPSGTVIYAAARDITERMQAEEEIRALNQQLERRVEERTAQLEAANAELEAFAYTASHDLRAPLRHLSGFVGLLGEKLSAEPDEEIQHFMAVISKSAADMDQLIDDLLSFSRMGRKEMAAMAVDLSRLVAEVSAELAEETTGRRVEWRIAPLPVVRGDEAMLRIAFVNLIANALKFTRPRECAVIEIGCGSGEPGETVVYVRDNGAGFDMRYAGQLFGVFQRLHRADQFEGTGIGLANVRRIVERHGGRVWAEGAVDEGAAFFVALPESMGTES